MVKTRQEIDLILAEYRNSLAALGIHPDRIYLFGSYARDAATDDSDLDLIVVSDEFAGMNLRERLEVLGVAAARIMQPVQALGYTRAELASDDKSAFIKEALSHARQAA